LRRTPVLARESGYITWLEVMPEANVDVSMNVGAGYNNTTFEPLLKAGIVETVIENGVTTYRLPTSANNDQHRWRLKICDPLVADVAGRNKTAPLTCMR